jgi:two-component system, OmpR family, heavy metal sensor histidine kinase CusS
LKPPPGFSLRRRLTLAVAGVLAVSLSAFSVVLDTAFHRGLREQFDARLAQDARAVATMVEDHGEGGWEFESGPLLGFEAGPGAAYFQVWTDRGKTIGRSPSLGESDLPRDGVEAGMDHGVLPDGRRGRWLRVELEPRRDPEVETSLFGRKVTVVVARSTDEIDAAMSRLRWLLWGSALTAMVLASLAGAVAVRRGLIPVERLGARIDSIDARRLDERLPTEGIPTELGSAVVKLNELLARLQASFERERRFGADASHELRTPLAGLRNILEVARSRDRTAAAYRDAIDDALSVTRQLSALVETLLTLARLDARQETPARESVELAELVRECYTSFEGRSRQRGLRFENRVPAGEGVSSDRERLRIVIQNLVSNAIDYTAERGTVIVKSDPARGVLLEVRDSGPPIPESALDEIFERFYRLDPSRSSTGEHWGIGLALARAMSETLDLTLSARNDEGGWVSFELRTNAARMDPRSAANNSLEAVQESAWQA